MTTVALLLAAGAGSRFAGPVHKLNAPFRGGTVAGAALNAVRAARAAGAVDRIVVVVGAVDLVGVDLSDVEVVHNPHWTEGQSTSLAVGIAAANLAPIDHGIDHGHRASGDGPGQVEAVVVALADQPFIDPSAWSRVAASDSPIAVASYERRSTDDHPTGDLPTRDLQTGHPIRLHRSVWSLLPTTGDSGARDLIRLRPDLVSQVACEGSNADIDTQEDLRTWT